jgi:hypothetical protein
MNEPDHASWRGSFACDRAVLIITLPRPTLVQRCAPEQELSLRRRLLLSCTANECYDAIDLSSTPWATFMSAFEDITAADFSETALSDDLLQPTPKTKWYYDAEKVHIDDIRRLLEQVANQSITEPSALSELGHALLSFASSDNRAHVLGLKGSKACILLDAIQIVSLPYMISTRLLAENSQWLDLSDPELPYRRRLLYLLIKLAAASEQLPTTIFIKDVDLGEARDPWSMGGFADIFRGKYRGRPVVGKRLRLHHTNKQGVHKVIETCCILSIVL